MVLHQVCATELEAARLLTYWVATKVDEDPDRMLPREASMVKLFVTETAQKAVQIQDETLGRAVNQVGRLQRS